MMDVTGDLMDLPEAQIVARYPQALALMEGFEHAPRAVTPPPPQSRGDLGTRRRFRSTTPGQAARSTVASSTVRLVSRIEGLEDDPLPGPIEAATLRALRRSLAIGLALGDQYAAASGLDAMKRANREGAALALDFADLLTAEALVTLHGLCAALTVLLAPHAGTDAPEVAGGAELLTDNAPLALRGALWELDMALTGTAAPAAPMLAWAEAMMQAVALRAAAAPRLDAFTARSWRVAADDLTFQGFAAPGRRRGTALSMPFKRPEEVVGNHIAKAQAMKLARMLMAYDFERRMNPFAELGGFVFTFLGDGAPGTGKTTLIQMMAGLVHGYCQIAGYPFHYQNFSIDQIDSYQGKSGQNAKAFVTAVLDPSVIGFGTIDDIDQIAGRRGDRQSSAGQQEVTAVFMEAFAGANTVVRGNATFGMFSNYPENVDAALRQRAGARFLVDGPQTRADYIDILALLLGQGHGIPLGDHDLMAAQELRAAVAASYDAHSRPQEDALIAVWDAVTRDHGAPTTLAGLGTYLHAIQQADARFTGRAIKNITDAVKLRALDVDLPDDWMTAPDLFLRQPYETKLGMIRDLTQPITVQKVLQEINRYADSEFRYAGSSDEAAIEAGLRDLARTEEMRRRHAAGRA